MKRGFIRRRSKLANLSPKRRREITLERAWKSKVRSRDRWCQAPDCGATLNLECHHVMPKGMYVKLKWVPENGLLLCSSHHDDWHRATKAWRAWWKERFPERAKAVLAAMKGPVTVCP